MYKVSDKVKQAIMGYKRDIRIKISIDNKIIDNGDIVSFNITESILQDDDFKLGGAVASLLELKLNNIHGLYNSTVFEGKKLNVEIGIKLDDVIEYVPMGEFFIEDSPSCGRVIEIEAIDNMVKFETMYESKLTYPATANQVLKEACDLCNIELEEDLNIDYIVESRIDFITCRDVVRDIAILVGGFAKINKNGKLQIVTLQDTDIEINKNNYISLEVKDSYKIEQLTITETNFPIEEPIEMNLNITPFNAEWQGYFFLDVGDKVKINDGNKVYETILTTNEITYNGGIRYKSSCPGLNKTQQETQHISNQTKTNQKFASEIKQNAEEISMRVRNDELETIVTQNADSWGLSINGKLKNVNCLFNDEGMNIYNGSLKIYDKAMDADNKKVVFGADNTGTLNFSGNFQQTDSNGNKSIEIKNNAVKIYNWKQKGDYVGSLGSLVIQSDSGDKPLIGLWNDTDSALSIAYQSDTDANTMPAYMYFDKYNVLGNGTDYPIVFNLPAKFKNGIKTEEIAFSEDANAKPRICGYGKNNTNYIQIIATDFKVFANTYISQGLEVKGNISSDGDISASNIRTSGEKNCIQKTESYGDRLFYSVEDAQSFLTYTGREEYIVEKNEDGFYERKIYIDEIFKECVNLNNYNIEIYKIGWGDYRIKEKTENYFVLESDREDFTFNYCIKAKRKGFEDRDMNEFLK